MFHFELFYENEGTDDVAQPKNEVNVKVFNSKLPQTSDIREGIKLPEESDISYHEIQTRNKILDAERDGISIGF